MRAGLRACFVAIAMLVLATQAGRLAAAPSVADAPDLSRGLAALGLVPGATLEDGTLSLHAEGCAVPVRLAQVGFNGAGEDAVRALLATGATPRFVYLGHVGAQADTAALLARWAGAATLHTLGLRRRAVPADVILVMVPSACPSLAARDWSLLSPWS